MPRRFEKFSQALRQSIFFFSLRREFHIAQILGSNPATTIKSFFFLFLFSFSYYKIID